MKPAQRLALALVTALAAAHGAQAEGLSPEPEYSLSYNIGAVSDYRVRGIAQTDAKPAVQGGIDLALKSGLYAGTFLSNVAWVKHYNGASRGGVEWDLYGGYKDAITSDLAFDAGVISYQYVNNDSGAAGTAGAGLFGNATTAEVYLNLAYKNFNLKVNRSIGGFLGNIDSSGSLYVDLNAAFDLGNGFTLLPHVGHQTIPHQGASGHAGDYTDASLALSKDLGDGLSVTATALATNTRKGAGTFYHDLKDRDLGKAALTLGVKYAF